MSTKSPEGPIPVYDRQDYGRDEGKEGERAREKVREEKGKWRDWMW